jgi:undecaprenyl-diphosphatase
MTLDEEIVLAVGFVVSFLVALLVIAGFMRFISRHDFKPFGYYRIVLGGVVLAFFLLVR